MGQDGGGADATVDMKIVMVGDMGVGKTCVAARFIRNHYTETEQNTIGASYMSKESVVDDVNVKFSLWDTAGQEQYHSLVPVYFRSAAAVVLMYDITSKDSLERIKMWEEKVRASAPQDVIIAVVGNKLDLEAKREVSKEEANAVKNQLGGDVLFEVSAKNAEGVFELFESIAKTHLQRREKSAASAAQTANVGIHAKRADMEQKKQCKC